MTYNVRLSPHAAKDYQRLDASIRSQMQAGLDALQSHPLSGPKIKRLKGRLRDYWRYRVGDYRIVYAVDQQARVVYVEYLQHRKDVYRAA